ncbi:MAG: FHA domain-containing protein, partial [Anaerolineae bacterium]|nr:FHA domain-containing protein [Anaerolineae bacterium]
TKPITIRVEDRIIVGRSVMGDPKRPDVDLEPYGAEGLGVSRHHLAIFTEAERLMVMDTGSNNGTLLNGNKLKANEGFRLAHGDKLSLGRMHLDVSVVLSPEYGGDVHKQPSLQLADQTQAGKGQIVLIVENEPQVAAGLSTILERAGYAPKVNHEVVGAIRNYNQRRPSAIVLDLILPDMSGIEFCRYVRRDPMQNTVPIVIVGALRSAAEVAEAMQAGADIFLAKPVSAKELRHVVSSLIYQQEIGSSAMYTKHLVGTAPLKAMPPESRRNAAVLFIAGYADQPITMTVSQPVSFGRTASTGSLKSHLDLTRYDAANTGVSRLHMFLHHKDGQFFVEDADSINGTYVNGDPLKPRTLTPVKNADEIRLGQLRMYIYFLDDSEVARAGDESEDGE